MDRNRRPSLRRALASLLTGVLISAGAIVGVAAPAQAAGGAAVSVPVVPRAGATVEISGSGFDSSRFGLYLGVRAVGASSDSYTVWIDDTNTLGTMPGLGGTAPMNVDGTFTVQVPVPAYSETGYVIVTRGAHGVPMPQNETTTPVVYEAAPAQSTMTTLTASPAGTAVVGATVTLSASVSPAASGSVEFFDGAGSLGTAAVSGGTATTTTSTLTAGAHELRAVFTSTDAAFTGSTSSALTYTITAVPTEPEQPGAFEPAAGDLVWGFKASWRSYVVGPYTKGTITTTDGAGLLAPATPAASAIGWPADESSFDEATGEGEASFAGATRFLVTAHGVDLTVANPRVVLDADGSADIYWTITGAAGTPVTTHEVLGATATATVGAPLVDGSTSTVDVSLSSVVFTAEGAAPFGDRYAGAPMDDAKFSITYANEVEPEPAAPALTVFLADGVTPYAGQPVYTGDVLVVKGTGFDPTANVGGRGVPIPSTLPQGSYVVFGSFKDVWQPSLGTATAPTSSRVSVDTKWALAESVLQQVPAQYQSTVRGQWAPLAEDGSFTTTLTAEDFAKGLTDGNWGVYSYGAGGVANAAQEISVPVDYRGARVEEVDEPSITLSADTVVQGGTLTVSGSGFPSGSLVTVTVNSDPITLGTATPGEAGTFSVTGTIPADFATGSHTVVATDGDITVRQTVAVTAAPFVEAPVVEPAPVATCTAQAVTGASITWNVKQSFRDYINGSIANGSYSINWGSGAGAYNTDDNRGRVSYGGSAHFTGHSGALDLTISNPRIQVYSSGSAALIANVSSKGYGSNPAVNASGVVIANLSLPAVAVSGNTIRWNGASATLTAAGASAFGGFYAAGDALDPVSFAFPLGAEVPCDTTTSNTLAATGGSTPDGTLWLGLSLLVLGAAFVAVRRRNAVRVG